MCARRDFYIFKWLGMKTTLWSCSWHLVCASLSALLMINSRKVDGKPANGQTKIIFPVLVNSDRSKYNLARSLPFYSLTSGSNLRRNVQSFTNHSEYHNIKKGILEHSEDMDSNVNEMQNTNGSKSMGNLRKTARLKREAAKTVVNSTDIEIPVTSHFYNLSDAEMQVFRNHFHNVSIQKRIALDAQRAYFCIVFIILLLIFAVWYGGLCRIRKHSVFDTVDFESSQPLSTVKAVILRKSRYLPMFAEFYESRKTVDRATDP